MSTGDESLPVTYKKRVYLEDVNRCGRKQSLLSAFIAMASLGLFYAWGFIITFLLIAAFFNRAAMIIYLLLLSTLALPAKVHWQEFLSSFLFQTWREYFSFSYYSSAPLAADKKYVLAEFPHGVVPVGPMVAASVVDRLWPGVKVHAIAASVLFYIPGFKHFMSWIGCEPATRENLYKLVDKGACAVIVGGVAEMFMIYPDREEVLVKKRQGFIKAAIELGAEIIPVYYFGNSQLSHVLGGKTLQDISRKLQMSIIVPYGRWYSPVPFQTELMLATGVPVPTTKMFKNDPGFEAQVEEVQTKFIHALQDIYDEAKVHFGWEKRPLKIV